MRVIYWLIFAYFFLFSFVGTASAAALYDTFSGSEIDNSKWHRGGTNDTIGLNEFRVVKNGTLRSYVAGAIGSDGELNNEFTFANPDSINTIEADIYIESASLSGDVFADFVAIEGNWYSEATGDVWANIVFAYVGTDYVIVYSVGDTANFFTTPITPGTTHKLKIEYNGTKGFTFTLDDAETHTMDGPDRTGPANMPYKGLATGVAAENPGDTGTGSILAVFDNVTVKDVAGTTIFTEDFASSPLDPARWSGNETVRNIKNGQLQLKVQSNGTGIEDTNLFVQSANISDFLQADVTIQSTTVVSGSDKDNNQGQTRLMGRFFNTKYNGSGYNGQDGNIYAMTRIKYFMDGSFNPQANVFRCDDATCSTSSNLFAEKFACTPALDTPITMSIKRTGATLVMKCGNEQKSYTLSGPLYEPETSVRFLRTRSYAETGENTRMNVRYDNVYTQKTDFPWTMFLVPIFAPKD